MARAMSHSTSGIRDSKAFCSSHERISHSTGKSASRSLILEKNPSFITDRSNLFSALKEEHEHFMGAVTGSPIQVSIKNTNRQFEGQSWITTPYDIFREQFSKKELKKVIAAKVKYLDSIKAEMGVTSYQGTTLDNLDSLRVFYDRPKGNVDNYDQGGHGPTKNHIFVDLHRPLVGNCQIEPLSFDHPDGRDIFWHSSAHILGGALENLYGGHLCMGPPLENGFFYDMFLGEDFAISQSHFDEIENEARRTITANLKFERIVVTKERALQLFEYNPFKRQIIENKIPDGSLTTVYRCGSLVDLCTGPHITAAGQVRSFKCMKNSSTFWLGDAKNDSLQRVYGITFPEKGMLEKHLKMLEEAKQRDHRNIGKQQELFFFHPYSPGSCFFLPHGAKIYNRLNEFLRGEYRKRGYQEVITPNLFNLDLWKQSGHSDNYQDDMFLLNLDDQVFGLKPMNCPAHCLMFDHKNRSYRDLPIKFADFGVLHRNELSGALNGLIRVRRFQQDDAHIFCRPDQIMEQITDCLEFLKEVYSTFGFRYDLFLSTRPEDKFIGTVDLWDKAEKALKEALDKAGEKWELNPGDGAFYGPKIDIQLYDALNRPHQCGTIQLDFNLPKNFSLRYRNEEVTDRSQSLEDSEGTRNEDDFNDDLPTGYERPVIIHRAILGSAERMIAILTENYKGKWPFWLSPRQAVIIPISEKHLEYAERLREELCEEEFEVEMDTDNSTLNKKIRKAQLSQFNYMVIVGDQEVEKGTLNVRTRENKRLGEMTLGSLIEKFEDDLTNFR